MLKQQTVETEDKENEQDFRVVREVLLYLLIWLVVLTALTAQTRWGAETGWPQAIVRVVRDWTPWVILGPLLWWLVKRFPLFGQHRLRHVGIHLLASLVMVVIAETLIALVVFPATQPVLDRHGYTERSPRREMLHQSRRREALRSEYRIRPRTLVRKAQIWMLLNWVFVLLGTAMLQRREAEERARRALQLQSDLAETRFRELQNRLQPHFFFNALNSISALILIDPERAEEMVSRLSNLMRRVLTTSEQPLIPLREELSLLRDYLAIEKVRMPDRLTVEESIDEKALSCVIPPLTLQPLAENAVKHGIEPNVEPSLLQIIASLESDMLTLQIADDGVGAAAGGSEAGLGIGIGNVRGRLETAFPDGTSLTVEHPPEGGTLVTIRVPAQTETSS